MKRILMSALAILAFAPAAFPCRVIIDEDRLPGGVRPLAITHRSFHVEAKVRDQVAEVVVTPVFRNPNSYAVEGTYFLSIPANAQVRDFTMKVGDKIVAAELLDAAKARAIYESIVRRQRDPALLELTGTRMLKASIFPIAPGAEVQVTVSYTALLTADGRTVTLELPFSNQFGGAEPVPQVSVRVAIDSKDGLRTIYSPTHDVEVKRPDDRKASISYEARNYDVRRAFRLHWSAAGGDIGASLLTWRKGAEDGYFAFLASPKSDLAAKIIPRDIVFVFDRSGSMAGEKIEQGRESLRLGIDMLAEGDRFGIVDFASEAESFRPELAAASKENRAQARDYVGTLRAAGSTNINDALMKALDLVPGDATRMSMVFFITDGLPTVGEKRFEKILENARTRAARPRIFVFGIGADVNTDFLDRLAEEGRGARDYVAPQEKIEGKVSLLLEKLAHPVLANLAIDFGAAVARDVYPRTPPDLFKGGQIVLFGRYRGSGPSKITLTGSAAGEAREFSWDVHFPADESAHDSVPRLWASRKVAWLVDSIRLGATAPAQEVVDEIVALGKRHGIVTPYTSFLITEEGEHKLGRHAREALEFLKKDAAASGGAGTPPPAPAEAPKAQEASKGLDRGRNGRSTDDLDKEEKDARVRLGGRGVAVKRAADRTFYLRDGVWTDSTVEAKDLEGAIKIVFLSDEHLALAASDPDLAKCLSMGERVTVAWKGKVYRVEP